MKRTLLALLLACVMMTASVPCAMGTGNAQTSLSQMTEEECIAFITSRGLSIPKELAALESIAEIIQDIIIAVENNPNITFAINDYLLLQFANDIKALVNAYYYDSSINIVAQQGERIVYFLEDSEIVGPWTDAYTKYNCYAYALGYTSSPTGSYYAPHPGFYSDPSKYIRGDSIHKWAELTIDDLRTLSYSCVYSTTDYSEIMSFADSHTIICLRRSDYPDYHYMRLVGSDWYHKPGPTHLLRYLHSPNDVNVAWSNEQSYENESISPTIYYTGLIYYFAFRTAHNTRELGHTGNNYHLGSLHYFEYSKVCNDCGAVINYWVSRSCDGPPCQVQVGSIEPEEPVE